MYKSSFESNLFNYFTEFEFFPTILFTKTVFQFFQWQSAGIMGTFNYVLDEMSKGENCRDLKWPGRGHCQKWNRYCQNRINIVDSAPLRRSLSSSVRVIIREMHNETNTLIPVVGTRWKIKRRDHFLRKELWK